ncbi:MAG: XRE family transcriptional regulator [Candidatus Omnitrophota bacterium]
MKLGKKLKLLRKGKHLTLDALSQMSGVGKATLCRIENGITTGNLNTHLRICHALNLNIGEFYKDLDKKDEKISFLDNVNMEEEVFTFDESVTSVILSKPIKNKKMLPQLLTIAAGKSTSREENKPGTDKFIYCLEGNAELSISDKIYDLKKNSTIYFDASMPHAIKNIGEQEAKLLVVVSPIAL